MGPIGPHKGPGPIGPHKGSGPGPLGPATGAFPDKQRLFTTVRGFSRRLGGRFGNIVFLVCFCYFETEPRQPIITEQPLPVTRGFLNPGVAQCPATLRYPSPSRNGERVKNLTQLQTLIQPTNQPTNQPTSQPANQPSNQPTSQPTNQPTS